jgi:hypothetical protein
MATCYFVFDFLFATSRTHLKPVCIHTHTHSDGAYVRECARSFLWTGQIFGRVLSVAHTHTHSLSRTCVRPFSACYLDSHVIAQSFTAGLLTRQPMRTHVLSNLPKSPVRLYVHIGVNLEAITVAWLWTCETNYLAWSWVNAKYVLGV